MAMNFSPEEAKAILRMAASIRGTIGGRKKSARKAKAVRANGKQGGRPRKQDKLAA
jgi:hypothetical protein